MRRTLTLMIVLSVAVCTAESLTAGGLVKDGKYDFFGLSRYPEGGGRVKGVELYKVRMDGGDQPQKYNRRVTDWWPRKGVDFIEIQDGMIPREWTRAADLLDPDAYGDVKGKPTISEYESSDDIPRGVGGSYMRRIRGYITPGRDAEYTFTVATGDQGFIYVSTDETEAGKQLVCYQTGGRELYRKVPSRISKPIPMKKGGQYYYEVVHVVEHGDDWIRVHFRTDRMIADAPLGGDSFSTLDGKKGTFREERWRITPLSDMRQWGLDRTFKAHLIGFHGIGNDIGDPFTGEDYYTPAAVLRMEDGTKRTLQGYAFCRADREFLVKLFAKEMKRIHALADKTPYEVWGGALSEYPDNAKPGEPGTMRFDTEHYSFGSGSQASHPGQNWVNDAEPEKAARARLSAMTGAEYWWRYLEYGGHMMSGWGAETPHKFLVRVTGLTRDGHIREPGVNNGGYGSCRIAHASAVSYGLYHEMGHGMRNAWGQSHAEIFCDFQQDLATGGRAAKHLCSVSAPYRNPLYWCYPTTLFYTVLGEDPNWGYCAVVAMPTGMGEPTFFHTFARVGEQRGLFKNGIRGLGDTVGEFAARYAEFDFQNQEHLRFRWFAGMRNYLEAVDAEAGVYRIPWDEAPEPFGCNIVRLDPVSGSKEITADFRGYHDPASYSDWRACLVAVDREGKCRYSPMWNKGTMTIARREGDRRYWLTVAGTPTALLGAGSLKQAYEGRWACRYPWRVTLAGAVPGAPQHTRADLDDVYGTCGPWNVRGPEGILPPNRVDVPVTTSTERGRRFFENATAALEGIDEKLAGTESIVRRNALLALRTKVREGIAEADGAPHPNGGGWVAATAFASPTAYVGPKARVLGSARVLENASVEEFAVLLDDVQLSGHARVSGQAILRGKARLSGYQRAWQSLEAESAEEAIPELTPRDRTLGLDRNGLWANYAMDEPQAVMLENRYRHRNDAAWPYFSDSIENGYLYGRPSFKEENGRRGYVFDGRTQYAEMAPRTADLGAITIDMAFKSQGSGKQVLLDCGSGKDDCFVLMLDREGKPAFTATLAGKTVASLKSARPVKGEWARVRLEIDGSRIALWVNDEEAGNLNSDFRPAHAFPPGANKRSFIAASRDGADKFKGMIDSVVVYHKAHGAGFAELPPPILDAGRNPSAHAVADTKMRLIDQKASGSRKTELVDEAMRHYHRLAADIAVRMYDLRHRSPDWEKGLRKALAFREWRKEREALYRRDCETDEEIVKLKKEYDALQQQMAELSKSYAGGESEPVRRKREELRKTEAAFVAGIKDPDYLKCKTELEAAEADLAAAEARVVAVIDAMPGHAAAQEVARLNEERKAIELDSAKLEKEAFAAEADQFKLWDAVRAEIAQMGRVGLSTRSPNSPLYYRIADAQAGALQQVRSYREEAMRRELEKKNADYKRIREIDKRLAVLRKEAGLRRERAYAMETEYDNLKEKVDSLRRRLRDRESQLKSARMREGLKGLPGPAEKPAELRELEAGSDALRRKIDDLSERYVARRKREDDLAGKILANDAATQALFEKVMAPHLVEYQAAMALVRSGMAGWKNVPYGSYLDGGAGGYEIVKTANTVSVRDDANTLRRIQSTYAPENWKTSVKDWDGRTRYEADGNITPLVRKWIQRVRGK